ncbi:conserved Plasmodium protein, unknown function [Plasmodium malariae]|uniref:Uncharacterized protein n=1 Tax=Plasmodium malariae TaxID=5858 RepID=A0A1C3L092_PLAMA|nr:conserved Plasmodium protein, unknown function [Plasmodium malariae]
MKLLYICDTRFHTFNSKEKKYLFKYMFYSLQDLLNNSKTRDIKFWLVCINLIDYSDVLNFSDPFDYENVKKAIDKISPYFYLNNEHSVVGSEVAVDPLLAFLKEHKNIAKIKKCDKAAIISSNVHMWDDKISELKIIGNILSESICEINFFNVMNGIIDATGKMQKISSELSKYSNFFFKNIELNKVNILQISKEILAIKFTVSITLSLKNQLLLKCEARPLIIEVGHEVYVSLNKLSVEFDIRAKALKDGISQHLIYGIPIFLSNPLLQEQNLISLSSLSKELYENEQVLILRSNINPTDLTMHEKEVRFLWVGTPMIKEEKTIALCLHGLATQETYSLTIEECSMDNEKKIDMIEDTTLKEMLHFLILIEEFNPLHYSNERLNYSSKFSRNSLIEYINKGKKFKIRKNKLTLLKNLTGDSANTKKEGTMLLAKNSDNIYRKDDLKKKKKIIDPRSLLLANMNKAFQKNII